MANRNYASGVALEYSVKTRLEKKAYLCTRSAGSHSPADLLAASTITGRRLVIQCKRGSSRFGLEDARELLRWARAWDATPVLVLSRDRRVVPYEIDSETLVPFERKWEDF